MDPYFEILDETVTVKGKSALALWKEADALYSESFRIKQAVSEGLLPAMTMEQAEAIQKEASRLGDEAAYDLDLAEGYL